MPPNSGCGSTSRPAAESQWKLHGQLVTVALTFPYRIFVLGNRAITMKSSLTVRNE